MTELKTLKVEERFINYKVFSYLWLANTLRRIRVNVLFVEKNFNQQMEEAKLVQGNVERKGNTNMIKNILNNIQRFQEKHLKIGNRKIEQKLMQKQENDGETIKDYKLETIQTNLSERKGLTNMENVNYVEFWEIEKPIMLNTQRRTLF